MKKTILIKICISLLIALFFCSTEETYGGDFVACGYHELPIVMQQVPAEWPDFVKNNSHMWLWNQYMDIYRATPSDGSWGVNSVSEFGGYPTDSTLYDLWDVHWDDALALTLPYWDGECGEFQETDVAFNPAYQWTHDRDYAEDDYNNVVLYDTVLVHELGHTWGCETPAYNEDYILAFPSVMHKYVHGTVPDSMAIHVPEAYLLRLHYSDQRTIPQLINMGVTSKYADESHTTWANSWTDKIDYNQGDFISVYSLTVENTGTETLHNVRVRFYLSPDRDVTPGDLLIDDFYWDTFPAERYNHYDFTGMTIPQNAPAGAHYVGAIVTYNGYESDALPGDNSTHLFAKITVGCTPPQTPDLVSPYNNITGVSVTPMLDWYMVAGATTYRIQVCSNSSCSSIVRDVTVATGEWTVNSPLQEGTKYWWRVMANKDDCSSTWSSIWNFTTCTSPAIPSLAEPPDGTRGVKPNKVLQWNSAVGATSYDIQVCDDSACSSVIRSGTVTGNIWGISPDLIGGRQYWWRVRASNNCDGSWSEIWSFITCAEPDSPILLDPPDGARDISISPILDWYPSRNATSYDVQICGNSTCSTVLQSMTVGSGTEWTVSPVLNGGTWYWWRVRAISYECRSPWSDIRSFLTEPHRLEVTKTVVTAYTRQYDWSIKKRVDTSEFSLLAGEVANANYTVTVNQSVTESAFVVSGVIMIKNPTNEAATIISVTDIVDGVPAEVLCGVMFPYNLPAGGQLSCEYEASLPDKTARYNYVRVETIGNVLGDEYRTDVNFGKPTTQIGPATVYVNDSNGHKWFAEGDAIWSYSEQFSCDGVSYSKGRGTKINENIATIVETNQSAKENVTLTCYIPVVSKTADTTFSRTWDWNVEKTADNSEITLSTGQSFSVNYTVTANATNTDSGWNVAGDITIYNPSPVSAMVVSVADTIEGIPVALNCGYSFLVIQPHEKATCTYAADLPDGSSRVNTATATMNGIPYTGTADIVFNDPNSETNECINLGDDRVGSLGIVCATDVPKLFNYSLKAGPYDLFGEYQLNNTVNFGSLDTDIQGSDSWIVEINVPSEGCTLSPEYWKAHSIYGSGAHDDTWSLLPPNAEDSPFFLSGQTWYEVLRTPPAQGNAYYILAHQFIAVTINILNGAESTSEVDAAIVWANSFFNKHTPSSNLNKNDRKKVISYASLLGQYNNGVIGPGSCTE